MIGEKIRTFRQLRKYNQAYMADRLGISESTYGEIERDGDGDVNTTRLKEIAQILDIPVEVLIAENGPTITFHNGTFEIGYLHANEFHQRQIDLIEKVLLPPVEKLVNPIREELDFMRKENERIFNLFEKLSDKK